MLLSLVSLAAFSRAEAAVKTEQLLYALDLEVKVEGAQAFEDYQVTALLSHAADPGRVYLLSVDARSDKKGVLDLGAAYAEKKLGRPLKSRERKYAGALALKLMEDVARGALPEAARDIEASVPPATPAALKLIARAVKRTGGEPVFASAELLRFDPKVAKVALDPAKDGLDGHLFISPVPGVRPAVVVVGGSGGFPNAGWANYIAHMGYHVLAVRYFSYDANEASVKNGTISFLIDRTPLEIFAKAFEYVRKQPNVDADDVSFLGESRGGEAALLIAKHLGNKHNVRRIFANRPQHFVVGSVINGFAYPGGPERSSWSYQGVEIPYARYPIPGHTQTSFAYEFEKAKGTIRQRDFGGVKVPAFRIKSGFDVFVPPPESLLDVGSYNGKLLSIGGDDDAMWRANEGVKWLRDERAGRRGDSFILVRDAGHVTFPGILPDMLSPEFGVLFGKPVVEDVAAGKTIFVYSGGQQVPNAIYSILNQIQVTDGLADRRLKLLPFADYLL